MSILYNCHTDGDQYRITKFNDGEVESSYLCSFDECQCPAGHRPSCRHRLMLPMFIDRGAVNTFWFLDFERKGWVSNESAPLRFDIDYSNSIGHGPEIERSEFRDHPELWPHSPTVTTTDFDSVDDSSILSVAAKPSWRRI